MANPIGLAFRHVWHTLTSYDRHSTLDSPYRSGRHVPLNPNGIGVLSSVATAASDSRADIHSTYHDDAGRSSTLLDGSSTGYHGAGASSPNLPMSPSSTSRPYSPGLRSSNARSDSGADGFEAQSPGGEIPMQSFQDGQPPPPPASHSWKKIDKWAEENYPELWDQLGEGCTTNDLNDLEHYLDCTLPADVRESLQIHDGQERGGMPTGLIFGAMLLDCEEIVQDWEQWRKVNQEYLLETSIAKPAMPLKAFGGSSSSHASSSRAQPSPVSANNPMWRQDLMSKQESVPPNAIQRAYAHPAWIPLARDWGGNNLAVDLAPGPTGTWGQVILFGRDYDTKYVVARSWAAFLAIVADDLNSGKWFVDEDTNELKLREFKATRVEPAYFDILRWRIDQKYGRRANKRRSGVPNGTASPTGSTSPYASPTVGSSDMNGEPRGRSMHRLSAPSPLVSPIRPGYGGKSSPLARVTEETGLPLDIAITDGLVTASSPKTARSDSLNGGLLDVNTPSTSTAGDELPKPVVNGNTAATVKETDSTAPAAQVEVTNEKAVKMNGKQPVTTTIEETMKTIEI